MDIPLFKGSVSLTGVERPAQHAARVALYTSNIFASGRRVGAPFTSFDCDEYEH